MDNDPIITLRKSEFMQMLTEAIQKTSDQVTKTFEASVEEIKEEALKAARSVIAQKDTRISTLEAALLEAADYVESSYSTDDANRFKAIAGGNNG